MTQGHDNRRRFSRIQFHRPAELVLGTERVAVDVIDVSLNGALLQVSRDFAGHRGQPCSLNIRLEPSDASIRMIGEMAHVEPGRVGVRREEIDLESMAHLRRLVELNLGDPALLDREFDALVNERL
ncbi:MAG TPA: PilZ domain-containing protein [Anaeromyxobacteraceae bacterium]|nr:PilZ domain-containing protein [Anaeromyxobacteraceae bacterium]